MLVVFLPIFVADTKIISVYNFVAPLSVTLFSYLEKIFLNSCFRLIASLIGSEKLIHKKGKCELWFSNPNKSFQKGFAILVNCYLSILQCGARLKSAGFIEQLVEACIDR